MGLGIVSNTTAIGVQSSLQKANIQVSSSAMKLSTGSRIIQASDGASDLAIGTSLQGNVITLNAAWTNTQQANALLGVADGALKNITEILQRQKALQTQATSGTLDATTRGYLNLEFQNLVDEIDRISGTTNFNGIKLIDGSLYTPAALDTYSRSNSVSTQGTITFGNAAQLTDSTILTINGAAFTFKQPGTTALTGVPTDIDTTGAATAAATATLLYNAIQATINSIDPAMATAKGQLSGLDFTLSGAAITVTSKAAGTAYNSAGGNVVNITGNATFAAGDVLVNATDAKGATVALSTGGVTGTNGDLFAGTYVASATTYYSGTATTITRGIVADSILTAISSNGGAAGAGYASGVVTNGVSNNSAFVGKISGFEATYNSPGLADLQIKVGDYTYLAKNVDAAPAAATVVRLGSVEAGGGYFDLQIAASTTSGQAELTNQADADAFANRLNRAFEQLDFFQKRQVSSYVGAGSVFPTGGTTQSGNLSGSKFYFINNEFENLKIEAVKVTAPVSGGTESLIEVTVNGEVFRSGYDSTGVTTALGNNIAANANIGLVSTTDPRRMLHYSNGATAISITNDAEAQGLQKALERAFGVGQGGSALTFQVGTKSADTVSVQLQGAKSTDLYKDTDGIYSSIDITTLANASTASDFLDNAINTVTSLRASIGALQSRFNYAATNIQSSIQNQDAARGVFLDTDISQESTNFTSAQVRMQASISVLAQANQIPQSLLKLIG